MPQTIDFFDSWQEVPDNSVYDNGFKVAVGACSSATSSRTRRSAGRCSRAPRACSSPSCGLQSWTERRWIDVPALEI